MLWEWFALLYPHLELSIILERILLSQLGFVGALFLGPERTESGEQLGFGLALRFVLLLFIVLLSFFRLLLFWALSGE